MKNLRQKIKDEQIILEDYVPDANAFSDFEWEQVISKHWNSYFSGKKYPKEYIYEYIETPLLSGWLLRPCDKQPGKRR